ncbi:hypothetical protein BH11MYX1_BH11MYX1_56520 [soil metagenome]
MENLIESIRSALAPDATDEVKLAGASACRTILAALDSVPGQPLAATQLAPPTTLPIASVVAALRGVPADQLFDLAIAKLRAALPAGTEVPQAQALNFQFIPKTQLATLVRTTP